MRSAQRKGGAAGRSKAGRRKISFVAIAEESGSDEESEDEVEVDEVTELPDEEPDFAAPTSSAEVSPPGI